VVVDEDEEEDEDNCKEPRTIGEGEMVNTSAGNADTMVDDKPTVLPEQGQEMRVHTPQRQPPVTAPQPQPLEPTPRLRTTETHSLSQLEFSGLRTPQKHSPVAPTLRESEAAGNTSEVDVEQQLLDETAAGDGLPNVRLPEAHTDGSGGEE
jgi:hypothetical protein